MTQHFDVAVIGLQRPGIIAAALLAKRGRRVLLIDHGETSGTYRRNGIELPLAPSLLPSLDDGPQVAQVIQELGLGPDRRTQLTPLEPAWQVAMPQHRLDFGGDPSRLASEFGAEFPDLRSAFARLIPELFALDESITALLTERNWVGDGWAQRRFIKRLNDRYPGLAAPFDDHPVLAAIPADHPARDVLLAPVHFFSHVYDGEPSTLQTVRLLVRYLRGTWRAGDALADPLLPLLDAATAAGVEIRRGAVVQGVDRRGRRVRALDIADDSQRYTADFFLANAAAPLPDLFDGDKIHRRLTSDDDGLRQAGALLVINYVVHNDVLPRGMADAVVLLNGRRHQRDDNPKDPPLFLRRYPASRGNVSGKERSKKIAEKGLSVLSVAAPARTDDVQRSPDRFAALRRLMHERIARLVPFLDDFVQDTSLPIDTQGWDTTGNDTTVRHIDPWHVHPLYAPATAPFGVGGRPLRTYLKNMLRTGSDVLPGLGLEGDYMTGIGAADTLGQLAGKAWRERR